MLDGLRGKRIGELLARTRGSDVVDGHLGLMVQEGDIVLTSDPRDINRIIRAQGVRATTRTV